jgi:phage tail-like protein
MAVLGRVRSFHNKFMFTVEIDDFTEFCFHKAGPLESKIKKIEFWPGCTLIPDKSAGAVEYEDISLERGVQTGDTDLEDWYEECIEASSGTGVAEDAYKRNLAVVQRDRDGSPRKQYNVYNAWPCELRVGDWDASATSDKTIEMAKLTYDYFERVSIA